MNKKTKALLAVLAASSVISLAACGRSGGGESVDTKKSQLYLRYTNGGFDRVWIDTLVAEFEELYKNHSFEEGKVGVQIVKDFDKRNIEASQMSTTQNQVFLQENTDIFDFRNKGLVAEITDIIKDGAITETGEKETGKTIADKLSDTYKLAFGPDEHYYGLPLFETNVGLNYNVKMFRENGFLFAKGKTADDFSDADFVNANKLALLFVESPEDEKAEGPDGLPGTYDDGLPATYADFRALLSFIRTSGINPLLWNGSDTNILTGMCNDAWANSEGPDQMILNFKFEGTATNLLSVENNAIVRGEDGTPTKHSETIGSTNFKNLKLQQGRLDAIELAKIIAGKTEAERGRNYHSGSFNISNADAEEYFIHPSDTDTRNNCAMLVDGGWWFSEADKNQKFKTESEKKNAEFAPMPMPKATRAKVEAHEPNTRVYDRLSAVFINSKVTGAALDMCKTFVSFLHCDHSLQTYTKFTNTPRGLNYEIPDSVYNEMNYFAKRVWDMRTKSNTVTIPWMPLTPLAMENNDTLDYISYGYSYPGVSSNAVMNFIKNLPQSVTTEEYFIKSLSK